MAGDKWFAFPKCPRCGAEVPVLTAMVGSLEDRFALLEDIEDAMRKPLPNMACNLLGSPAVCGRCGTERTT